MELIIYFVAAITGVFVGWEFGYSKGRRDQFFEIFPRKQK